MTDHDVRGTRTRDARRERVGSEGEARRTRRGFLRGSLVAGGAVALPFVGARAAQDASPKGDPPYTYLTDAEAAFLRAAADRIIPPDDLPGGAEAGCVTFIDRQLAGPFGAGVGWYMQGPFGLGTDTQGYQLRLTPAALYRHAIAASDRTLGRLADQAPNAQDALLTRLSEGVDLEGVPSKTFFSLLLENVKEGYLADPAYGGNRNMTGWRAARFPGARGQWRDLVEAYGFEYRYAPTPMADHQGHGQSNGHDAGHEAGGTDR